MNINKSVFGRAEDKEVYLYTIENENNITIKITDFGGIVTHIIIPDKNGNTDDIVLGFDSLSPYMNEHPYFGAIIGRYANRIAKGKINIEGKEFNFAINNGPNHLHGGIKGFDKVVWKSKEIIHDDYAGIELEYLSADGEENYPGNLNTVVAYTLNNNNELKIEYKATTDKTTVVNLTHHGYFNLNGIKSSILNHLMQINADYITEVDENLIPTGNLINIKGNSFDFSNSKKIGQDIEEAGGYDHNYVLNKNPNELSFAAKVTDEDSGRIMEVFTTEPGMQFYSSNFLDGSIKGKYNKVYQKHDAFCLETQHFPDSPNHSEFPSTILNPGDIYKQTTIYKFSIG